VSWSLRVARQTRRSIRAGWRQRDGDGVFALQDADDLGASFDFAVRTLSRRGGINLPPIISREDIPSPGSGEIGTFWRSWAATLRQFVLVVRASSWAKAAAMKAAPARSLLPPCSTTTAGTTFQWCGRRESNPHGVTPNGFSYHPRLSPPRLARARFGSFVVWTIPSP
jgi:hypothetical protein